MVRTKGEWPENFRTMVAASILPFRVSKSWETRNLYIRDIAKHGPDLPLSKVNSFAVIFLKLSDFQAFNSLY
jgi:hypothetical protein